MRLERLRKNLNACKMDIISKYSELGEIDNILNQEDSKWAYGFMDTLCFSFSDILSDFIVDNKKEEPFKTIIKNNKDIEDDYIERVIVDWTAELPFCRMQPVEFFEELKEFKKELIDCINNTKREYASVEISDNKNSLI